MTSLKKRSLHCLHRFIAREPHSCSSVIGYARESMSEYAPIAGVACVYAKKAWLPGRQPRSNYLLRKD